MKVSLGTLEFDDDQRKLIAEANGAKGMATRELIRDKWVPEVIAAAVAKLEADSLADDGDEPKKEKKGKKAKDEAPAEDEAKPAKEGKKGKKSKDAEPEAEAETKKDKKGKKNKKG